LPTGLDVFDLSDVPDSMRELADSSDSPTLQLERLDEHCDWKLPMVTSGPIIGFQSQGSHWQLSNWHIPGRSIELILMAKETGLVTKQESRQIKELSIEITPQPEKRGESEKNQWSRRRGQSGE
jgi:hypothetical protein